jgi:hypothetical protein
VEVIEETVNIEVNTGKISRWERKLGKRSRKIDRWEKQWYLQWGLGKNCNICGEHRTSMNKVDGELGSTTYKYVCPVSLWDHWPPTEEDWGGLNIWNSLDASHEKLAFLHGYNEGEVNTALDKWENHGSGLLLLDIEVKEFKEKVRRICEDERQAWTFKRTLAEPSYLDDEYDL